MEDPIYTFQYPIVFDSVNEILQKYLQSNSYSSLIVLVDKNTEIFCLPKLNSVLSNAKNVKIISIKAGEHSKSIETAAFIWNTFLEIDADRQALFINLGGGVVSDLGAWCAANYKRGIKYINFPTTLLAQIDAAVGMKVAINLNHVKNAIGLFSNPELIGVDIDFLSSLPRRQLISGYAEMLKHGLIWDKEHYLNLISYDISRSVDISIIKKSIEIKNQIVAIDPKDTGIRQILNFGHSIGHAIESLSLNWEGQSLLHGEAIAWGMILETFISTEKAGLSVVQRDQILKNIMKVFKFPSIENLDYKQLIILMSNDKKNEDNILKMSLISSIGNCGYGFEVEPMLVKDAISYFKNLVS